MNFLRRVSKVCKEVVVCYSSKHSKIMPGRSVAKRNKLKSELAPNQSRITQFFSKTTTPTVRGGGGLASNNVTATTASSSSASSSSQARSNTTRNHDAKNSTDNNASEEGEDNDILEVIEVEKPPPSPKELVIISDTESESENGREQSASEGVGAPAQGSPLKSASEAHSGGGEGSPFYRRDSGDDILSQVDVDEMIRCSQTPSPAKSNNVKQIDDDEDSDSVSYSPLAMSDSGDEVLSQIDVDEVVRLSQSSLESSPPSSPSLLRKCPSTPNKENINNSMSPPLEHPISSSVDKLPTPKKSPKSQLNYFSPIRHLRKRTSSEASLGSPAKSLEKSPSKISPVSNANMGNGTSSNPAPNSKVFTPRKLNLDATGGASQSQSKPRYYLRNFMSILREVVFEPFHTDLISPDDHRTVEAFTSLSLDAQSLYVRLFQRKWGWKVASRLNNNYKELPPDLTELFNELTQKQFFEKISDGNSTLEEVLDTLDLGKILTLGKKMMINPAKKTKEVVKQALLTKVKSQKTLTGNAAAALLKTALGELGGAFRVSAASKALFSRLFILYSPPHYWEVETDQASNQLLVILLNNMGQMEYANYKVNKTTIVYRTREDLIRFHEAWCLHSDLFAFSESKDWESVTKITNQAKQLLTSLLQEDDVVTHDSSLPRFLRIYTAGSVLCHTCWMGVDGFQKLKEFSAANELINVLLKQTVYLPNYRGRLYERLAINASHLKQSKEELGSLLERSLRDAYLQDNHKLILSGRLEKVRASIELANKNLNKKRPSRPRRASKRGKAAAVEMEELDDLDEMETQVIRMDEPQPPDIEIYSLRNEIPTRTITGEKMDRGPGNMGKSVFISRQDYAGSNRISSVEQHCIDYYLENGYTAGIHGEGSTVTTIYGLLFWDVIFHDEIPDAFHTKYQPFPLDLHFDDFYDRRKSLIDEKLDLIRCVLGMEDLFGIVDEIWEKNENKLSIVNWSVFENRQVLKSLMQAMGCEMIAKLCERFARNYRYYASGFPDLVVWNDSQVLFVEVKGPGDSLSPKQQLWLDYLVSSDIPAEVCHVKAVSNKRIRLGK